MTENEAQINIIHYFIQNVKPKNPIIVIEFPFNEYARRADMVFIVDGLTHAVEIKTEKDNLDKLKTQINDYRMVFDFTYIAAEGKSYRSINQKIPKSTGIIEINGAAVIKRKPKRIIRLNKEAILSSIDSSFIKKSKVPHKKGSKHDVIVEVAKKLKVSDCRKLLVDYIINRLKDRSDLFLREVGNSIHTDDLLLLTRPSAKLSVLN